MPAVHKSASYKPLVIPNPFQEGGDQFCGDLLKHSRDESRRWRLVGIGSLVLWTSSILILWYAVSLQRTVPVLVNVLPSGESSYLGEVRQSGGFQVPEAAVLFQVRLFITNIRSVSVDHQVLYNNIDDCYSMATSAYSPIMTRMLQANSPFNLVGRVRRTVEIESVLRITGSSYQADWTELSIEQGGAQSRKKMRALVTVKLIPPDPSFMRENPLGIFIENCEWTEL